MGTYISTGYSLVDITNTGITTADTFQRNQQRNWETVIQVLGLRTQVTILSTPVVKERNVLELKFGKVFEGKHNVWEFKFEVEVAAIYATVDNPYGLLESDFLTVPIICNLSETAQFNIPTFTTTSEYKNIYFEPFTL